MKIFLIAIVSIINLVWANQIFENRDHSRAKWVDDQKFILMLDNRLNINDALKFYLTNTDQNFEISLVSKKSYNNIVELEVMALGRETIEKIIKGDLRIKAKNYNNQEVDSTSVQMPKILDKYFSYNKDDLGIRFTDSGVSLKLWAPTALSVHLLLFKNPNDENSFTKIKSIYKNNVWETQISKEFENYYYQYEISVYRPAAQNKIITKVTDPYSINLNQNSTHSQIVDLSKKQFKPQGWDRIQKPKTTDVIIYESHIRDLSANDQGIPRELRGTFLGLTLDSSNAKQHLKSLASSGMTYLHLLPINDFTSVDENKNLWEEFTPDDELYFNSEAPQSKINEIRYNDSYNWGYDPYHYMTPEGSYATNANGPSRILEFRELVKSMNHIGLKVIIDVVFNHTFSSGNDKFSILDKITPNYYYRLDSAGNVHNSSCCSDTATEHKMMEKLMIDTVVFMAKNYKVDGFRFDLMSFHTRENMINVKNKLHSLTLEKDGVDGKNLYLYGEGWNFGSLVGTDYQNAFTQLNSYGAGIGQFNDRFRDAIRGGTTSPDEKSDQGFATGLYTDFNKEIANRDTPPDLESQKNKLLFYSDVIKIGLAGNLRDYVFKNHAGGYAPASQFYFKGNPTGYAQNTSETVNYVSAHDGYSLWDAVVAKAPFHTPGRYPKSATSSDKQKMQAMALALTIFSQGAVFIEGGSEILRSKSGDVDSYNSGDWFNHLNWNLEDNNWAKGLPPSFKNYNDWNFWSPRLGDAQLLVDSSDIKKNLDFFKAYLKIRSTSTLFSFKDLSEIYKTITFIDNESQNTPGLIAFRLKNKNESILLFFNTNNYKLDFNSPQITTKHSLHPELKDIIDTHNFSLKNEAISLPAKSVIVLVENNE